MEWLDDFLCHVEVALLHYFRCQLTPYDYGNGKQLLFCSSANEVSSAPGLDILAVDPKHHYRGAGRMLVDWGTKVADNKDFEVSLYSSFFCEPLFSLSCRECLVICALLFYASAEI